MPDRFLRHLLVLETDVLLCQVVEKDGVGQSRSIPSGVG